MSLGDFGHFVDLHGRLPSLKVRNNRLLLFAKFAGIFNDPGGDEHNDLISRDGVDFSAEKMTDQGNVSQDWNLCACFGKIFATAAQL